MQMYNAVKQSTFPGKRKLKCRAVKPVTADFKKQKTEGKFRPLYYEER